MDTDTVIINNYPSPKEQLVSYALALGFTALSTVVVFGSLAVVGKVIEMKENRKAKKNETEKK